MSVAVFDDRVCTLGEGPLWHPLRKQLFWFDILENTLLTSDQSGPQSWTFDEPVSAAGWVDENKLLIASATGLWRFDLSDGTRHLLCNLEHSNEMTRSNDGRADPWGGFWIGTMAYDAAAGAGAIYRYYQGQLKTLFTDISISNAICFAADRSRAFFTDTATGKIMSVALDRAGWPAGSAQVFIDLTPDGLNPDGAVVDAQGWLWVAQWGAGRVAAHDKNGNFQTSVDIPAVQTTCPAFGGENLATLFVTSAARGLPQDMLNTAPDQGKTFAVSDIAQGLPEPRVLL